MTARVLAEASRLAGARAELRGATGSTGHAVIASRESYAAGAMAALQALRQSAGWPDAVLLACFGDPGLAELQPAAGVPVAGMAQSALREAAALARPYRIVTAGAGWPAMLREFAMAQGLSAQLEGIVALDTTGLAVSRDPGAFVAALQQALDDARADGVQTVVLGGAGFAGMRGQLRFDGTLIDGLEAALRSLGLEV